MPGKSGPQKFVCHWCRVNFGTYSELTVHHEQCPAKPTGKWETPDAKQTEFHCPHEACESKYTTLEALLTHLNHCKVIEGARNFADGLIFRDNLDSEVARELRRADFEKWCEENGR